jgi:hypothetical protein
MSVFQEKSEAKLPPIERRGLFLDAPLNRLLPMAESQIEAEQGDLTDRTGQGEPDQGAAEGMHRLGP